MSVQAPEVGRIDFYDDLITGLVFRVGYGGGKSWTVYYRSPIEMDGKWRPKKKRLTLGRYPAISLSNARKKAKVVLEHVAMGEDPQKEKTDAKQKKTAVLPEPVTVEQGIRRYIEEHVKVHNKARVRTDGTVFWEREGLLGRHVIPFLGGKSIIDLRRKDVLSMHRHVENVAGTTTADRAAESLRASLNWLDEAELVEGVPVIRLKSKARNSETARHRTLTDDEIRALWNGLDDDGGAFAGIVRLLLLTGQRRSEVAGIRWEEIDRERWIWSIPPGRTKNGLPHVVPLSRAAIEIVECRKAWGEFVFTSTGTSPFSGFSRSKARLNARIGFSDWILHDLRRTFVTRLNEMGVRDPVVEAIVNHVTGPSKAGVAGVYNRAQYLDERKSALNMWAAVLAGIIRPGEKEENVVNLPVRGR